MKHHLNLVLTPDIDRRLSRFCGATGVKTITAMNGLLEALDRPAMPRPALRAPPATLRLRLPPEVYQAAQAHCAITGQSMASLVNEGLDLWLQRAGC